jgi:CHAT domain-containing protein/tetratricopeptide (TPR) repeat protein
MLEASGSGGAEPLAKESLLFREGRFPELVRRLQATGPIASLSPGHRSLLVRSLLAMGRFPQAAKICAEVLGALDPDGLPALEMRLWQAQVRLYTAGQPEQAFQEGRAALERAPAGSPLAALARDLLARALAVAYEWGLAPAASVFEARRLMEEAAAVYRDTGEVDDFLSALLRLGQLQLLRPRDAAAARKTFARAEAEAEARSCPARAADAALRLAELDFDEIVTRPAGEGSAERAYDRALHLAKESGHALAPADVLASRGARRVSSGLDGQRDLKEALTVYEAEENLAGIQRVLSPLSLWHLKRGDLQEALAAHRRTVEISHQMGIPVAEATAILGIGDYYFRTGDYARALAEVERFEALASVPAVRGTVGLTLANFYSQMSLHDRAEAACRASIRLLAPAAPNDQLSLAWLILGNARSAAGDWNGAIEAWREGLAVDEALSNPGAQAQKLLGIAQAMVMRHYRSGGPPVPDAAFEEAMALHRQVEALLAGADGGDAGAILANNDQIRAQSDLIRGHLADARAGLERAAGRYRSLGLAMQTAFVETHLGLLLLEEGKRQGLDPFQEAERHLRAAVEYFAGAGMRDMAWRPRFHLAHACLGRARLSLTGEAQREAWGEALNWLEQAATDLEAVRGAFVQAGSAAREEALLGLVSNTEKVYELAILVSAVYLGDGRAAFGWLERAKSRVFLNILALTPLRPPDFADPAPLAEEQALLEELRQAPTGNAALAVSERLHAVWDRLAADPAAAEYVAMRRGDPLDWEEVRLLLRGLSPGRRAVLAEYFTSPMLSLLFVGREDFEAPRVIQIPRPLAEIQGFVTRHFGSERRADGSGVTTGDKLRHLDERAFRDFFAPFVAPLAGKLPTGDPVSAEEDLIWLVPHGILHSLPLHALEVDGRLLGERNPMIRTPSASALRFCRGKRKGSRRTALVLGDSVGDLPYARREARGVAQLFGTAAALGAQATRAFLDGALARDRDGIDLLHFACHGVFDPRQALRSGIVLAPEPGRVPGGEVPVLAAGDVLGMEIRADLVTLSACESGVNDRRPGDELVGLTRAWIYAGTPSVLATLWPVDDLSSQLLMESFYRELAAGTAKSEALRKAQIYLRHLTGREALDHFKARLEAFEAAGDREGAEAMKRNLMSVQLKIMAGEAETPPRRGQDWPLFDHAYFWAPYVLIGDAE